LCRDPLKYEKSEEEEITIAEGRGTLKNERSEEEEITTAERRGTLLNYPSILPRSCE
jgi:hypothetical protein